MSIGNVLKQRLARGEALFGAWIETGSAVNAEILGHQGFDFLILDLEHGHGDLKDAVDMLRAAQGAGNPLHCPNAMERPCLSQADSRRGREFPDDPFGRDRARSRSRGARLPISAAGTPRLCRAARAGLRLWQDRRLYAARQQRIIADHPDRSRPRPSGRRPKSAPSRASMSPFSASTIWRDRSAAWSNSIIRRCVNSSRKPRRRCAPRGKPMGTVPSAGATWRDLLESGYRLVPVASDVGLMRDAALDLRARATPLPRRSRQTDDERRLIAHSPRAQPQLIARIPRWGDRTADRVIDDRDFLLDRHDRRSRGDRAPSGGARRVRRPFRRRYPRAQRTGLEHAGAGAAARRRQADRSPRRRGRAANRGRTSNRRRSARRPHRAGGRGEADRGRDRAFAGAARRHRRDRSGDRDHDSARRHDARGDSSARPRRRASFAPSILAPADPARSAAIFRPTPAAIASSATA